MPRFGVRGVPFARKSWDDPRRFPLNRAYGDEFEYQTFAELSRRWAMNLAVAADFNFLGSAIEWVPSAAGSSIGIAIPSGDFEAVLELSGENGGGMPGIGMLDAVGTGSAGVIYNDGSIYNMNIVAYVYSSTGNGAANGLTLDNRHHWLAVKRVGSNLQTKVSNNGTSFTAYTTAGTLSGTATQLTIGRFWNVAERSWIIHRLNVYPGSTFFTG